jgi:calcium-dependent protein kinase
LNSHKESLNATIDVPKKADSNLTFKMCSIIPAIRGELDMHYDVKEKLGAGPFAQVRSAEHKRTKIMRAVKSMQKNTVEYDETVRIIKEIDMLKNLDHPNIIKLVEIVEDKENYHLVMEL